MTVIFSAFLFFLWVGFAVVAAVFDQTTVGTSTWAVITTLDIWREAQISLLWLSFTFPVPNTAWFASVFGMLLWDSTLWDAWGNLVRIPLFVSLTFGVVVSFLLSLFGSKLSK